MGAILDKLQDAQGKQEILMSLFTTLRWVELDAGVNLRQRDITWMLLIGEGVMVGFSL